MTLPAAQFDGEGWLIVDGLDGGREVLRPDDGYRVQGFAGGRGDVVVSIQGLDSEREDDEWTGAVVLELSEPELGDLIDHLKLIRHQIRVGLMMRPPPGLGAAGAPVPHAAD